MGPLQTIPPLDSQSIHSWAHPLTRLTFSVATLFPSSVALAEPRPQDAQKLRILSRSSSHTVNRRWRVFNRKVPHSRPRSLPVQRRLLPHRSLRWLRSARIHQPTTVPGADRPPPLLYSYNISDYKAREREAKTCTGEHGTVLHTLAEVSGDGATDRRTDGHVPIVASAAYLEYKLPSAACVQRRWPRRVAEEVEEEQECQLEVTGNLWN